MSDIDWDLIRAQTGGAFLGKAMKDFGTRIVEQAAVDVLKYKPADWKSYLRSRCKELKKADTPKIEPTQKVCECGGFAVAPEGRCIRCHHERMDKFPELKSGGRLEAEEIEAQIYLEAGDSKDYPNVHRYLMEVFKVCGQRLADERYKTILRKRYAEEKKKAESMERIEGAGI